MSETILVVDDEENIRHTLRGVLADEGFEVLEAPDGRRALELLQHAAPRLAIVDVWMPEMDGIELVERMRNQAPGVPIIVISGHGTIETAVRVIRLGAFDFLEKPFPLDALLSVVGRALGTSAAPAETAAPAATGAAPRVAPARRLPERTIGRSVLACALRDVGGLVDQPATVQALVVDQRCGVGSDDPARKGIAIEPADRFEVHYVLDCPPPIGRQELAFRFTDAEAFRREIAPARTFGFVDEIEQLEQMGLANGGRLNNCILVGKEGVVNAPLRFPDEFVRHKILDIFGDFYLLGRPIRGRVVARMTGHSDNAALLGVLRARFGVPPLKGA